MADADEERRYKIYSELQRSSKSFVQSVQQRLPSNLLSDLAYCLLNNSAVFTIVSDLKEIQDLTEKQLFRQRQKLASYHQGLISKLRNEQREEMQMDKEYNNSLLRQRHENEKEQLERQLQTEMNKMDSQLLCTIDDKVIQQQTALTQVGVPGFSTTFDIEEIQLQMAILLLIQDVHDQS